MTGTKNTRTITAFPEDPRDLTDERRDLCAQWDGQPATPDMIAASDATAEGWIILNADGLVRPGSWDEQHTGCIRAYVATQ